MNHDPIVWYQWRYQLRNYQGGSQNHKICITWAKLSPKCVHKNDNVEIKCTTRHWRERLDHIMHWGSPKIIKNWQKYQLKGVKDHAYLRGWLPCMYQFESDLQKLKYLEDENLVHQD